MLYSPIFLISINDDGVDEDDVNVVGDWGVEYDVFVSDKVSNICGLSWSVLSPKLVVKFNLPIWCCRDRAITGYWRIHCCGAVQLIKGHFGEGSVRFGNKSLIIDDLAATASIAVSFMLYSLVRQFVHNPSSGLSQ